MDQGPLVNAASDAADPSKSSFSLCDVWNVVDGTLSLLDLVGSIIQLVAAL